MMEIRLNPTKNYTGEIVEKLLHAKKGESLIFEKGIYNFYADETYIRYFAPGCNTSGDKKIVFPLINLDDITIDGNGSKFIFHDRVFPFILFNSKNITLKNFSINFSFPRCMLAIIKEVNKEGIRLFINKEKYCYCTNEKGEFLIKAGKEVFNTGERRFFLKQGYGGNYTNYCCFLIAPKSYCSTDNLPADLFKAFAEETEDGIFLRYADDNPEKIKFTENAELMISYDEMRENDIFFFERCKDITLENIHIIHGAGMGFTGQCTENITFRRCSIKPDNDGAFSTTADGILLTNFSGTVNIEDCYIKNTLDDSFSIHGFYGKVEKITGSNKILLKLVHTSQGGVNFLFPGDKVHISDGTSLNDKKILATVKEAYFLNDLKYINVEFQENIENIISPGDYIDNPDRTPNAVIRNCVFENALALRIGTSGKVVFENNTVKNCSGMFINDLLYYWSASGLVRDVQIKNNTFENCIDGVKIFVDRHTETEEYHKNILIENNIFVNCKTGINADKADTLTIKNNIFKNNGKKVVIKKCINTNIDKEAYK